MFFPFVANLQNTFQHVYWKKSMYTTHKVQTCIVQGLTVHSIYKQYWHYMALQNYKAVWDIQASNQLSKVSELKKKKASRNCISEFNLPCPVPNKMRDKKVTNQYHRTYSMWFYYFYIY